MCLYVSVCDGTVLKKCMKILHFRKCVESSIPTAPFSYKFIEFFLIEKCLSSLNLLSVTGV